MADNTLIGDNTYLGRGWSFPVTFTKSGYTVTTSQDDAHVLESLKILLSTNIGERVLRPEYGGNLQSLLFEPLNVTTLNMIFNRIKRAIKVYEPRIKVEAVNVVPDLPNGLVQISIDYTVITTNTRNNLVFPFYLTEGTNL